MTIYGLEKSHRALTYHVSDMSIFTYDGEFASLKALKYWGPIEWPDASIDHQDTQVGDNYRYIYAPTQKHVSTNIDLHLPPEKYQAYFNEQPVNHD